MLVVALLGASAVVLPALAGSETVPAIEAVNSPGYYGEQHHSWSPATATVSPGGVLTLSNPSSEVKHGVEWTGGPSTPSCSGVPVGSSGTSWHGECTFAQPGTYTFRCTVHPTEMIGAITVNADGTTTPLPTTTTTQSSGTSGGSTLTSQAPSATPGPQVTSGAVGSPLAGTAAEALRLTPSQHSRSVRGSLRVSPAGAGGRLEVDLLAKGASLARASQVTVGRIVRFALLPGTVSFSAPLNAKAKRALRVHRRLALTVRLLLTPPQGPVVTLLRAVVLHA
jgi:plastocyanin